MSYQQLMNVLFVAAEATPYSKVGGLADVAGSLPRALVALGHDVRLVTPAHQALPPGAKRLDNWPVVTLGRTEEVTVWEAQHRGVTAYIVDAPAYFRRSSIYGQPDDLQRFWFFAQVALELPRRLDWKIDVLHCHDWHTAPLCFGLRNRAWGDAFYQGTGSVFTIHNLRYRGPDELTDFNSQGIYYADKINTVSPTYAQEICTPAYGEGLDTLLRLRASDLAGILNGLDYDEWNPSTDPWLAAHFDASTIEQRARNRQVLRQRTGLASEVDLPLIGMIGRLTEQKGIDLALTAMEPLLAAGKAQAVVLGQGDEQYRRMLVEIAGRYPGQLAPVFAFAEDVARLIYGGSDLFLMPSRFEPCGLGQLIAMRYGAVPVVRRTGGLADTVQDYGAGDGVGFAFEPAEPLALAEALDRALAVEVRSPRWYDLVRRGMARDFSWGASAHNYEELYRQACRRR